MRDNLPQKVKSVECAVVNLDSIKNEGTHWVAYIKIYEKCWYFDSFGNLKPPLDLMRYLGNTEILYNYNKYQNFNSINCGHLCLQFLHNFWKNV